MTLREKLWISVIVLTTLVFAVTSSGLVIPAGSVQRADGGSPIPPPPSVSWSSATSA
jgi:hypothetical protein